MKLDKFEKLEIIENWISDFPCDKYFKSKQCIHEFISAEDIYEMINNKRNKNDK